MRTFKYNIIVCFLLCTGYICCSGQNRNAIWCFGDSALIDFNNPTMPVTGISGMKSRGSSTSIADTTGSLLFYAATRAGLSGNTTLVFDSSHAVMINGDSIVGEGWYQELTILPMPNSSSLAYLFSVGITGSSQTGFYYSIIDMTANSGLGAVLQKNVQLETFKCSDGLTALKHANGRDWWILIRNWNNVNDKFYKYLVSPNGVSNAIIQNIGSPTNNGFGKMKFSKDGSRMAMINFAGLMEVYDFDRCTGIISNPVTIHPEPPTSPYGRFWSCEFSPDGRFLYANTYSDNSALYQYNLIQPNPASMRILLDSIPNYSIGMGFLKLAPDDKIYFSMMYECLGVPNCYPFPDSIYNYVNMNLSVINYPDSLGTASGYAPFSFYLGGKRTYYGLPNNPDYDMPALAGSPCDTLVSIKEPSNLNTNAALHVYYAPDWEKAFINADKLKGNQYSLRMIDILGKEVYSESGTLNSQYFTRDLNCASFASGIYMITFETERERLVKKMQVNWR